MKSPWRRLIVSLLLGTGIVILHAMYVDVTDDFVLVRPYKSGYAEIYSGSIRPGKKGLLIPMPDGSRELVPMGEPIGYKVFKYGFPFSYATSSEQLPICTPRWQVPIRIGLNILFFAFIVFVIFTKLSANKRLKGEPTAGVRPR